MTLLGALLIAALSSDGASLAASTEAALPGVQVEEDLDSFADCFEPRLADDPVIKSPIEKTFPIEALDNRVSNEAFKACQALLPAKQVNWNEYRLRLGGARLMGLRNSFYASRGEIDLKVRRKIRPHLGCIEDQLNRLSSDLKSTDEASKSIADAQKACEPSLSVISFSGSETDQKIRSQVLARYVNNFAHDILAFKMKAPFREIN